MVRQGKGGGIERGGGGRRLAVKLRTAKGRKTASTRWLQRQLNDPYVEEAKRRGYRSRAAFKLIEIDDKHHILKPGMNVLDLGRGTRRLEPDRGGAGGFGRGLGAGDRRRSDRDRASSRRRGARARCHRAGNARPHPGGAQGRPAPMWCCPTWRRPRPGTGRPTICAWWRWSRPLSILPRMCWRPAAPSSPKCFRAAPGRSCVTRLKQSFAKVSHVKPKASRPSPEVYVLARGMGRADCLRFAGRPRPSDGAIFRLAAYSTSLWFEIVTPLVFHDAGDLADQRLVIAGAAEQIEAHLHARGDAAPR